MEVKHCIIAGLIGITVSAIIIGIAAITYDKFVSINDTESLPVIENYEPTGKIYINVYINGRKGIAEYAMETENHGEDDVS